MSRTPGQVGRVAVCRFVPSGYYKDEAKSAQTFLTIDGNRYSVPGDFARVDVDGSVRLLGRGSQCINTGGEKVFPEEVEEVLKTYPGVNDAAVVGVADERFGEAIVALVAVGDGPQPDDGALTAHVRAHLAAYKAPRQVVTVHRVPRTPSGKLDYPKIADQLRQREPSLDEGWQ